VGGDFNQRREDPKGWAKLTSWRKKLHLGGVLAELHPTTKFVTYRAKGAKSKTTGKHKRIATWISLFCLSQSAQ
jgi:hypothetical protein